MAETNSPSLSVTCLLIVFLSMSFVSIHGQNFGEATCDRTIYPKICRLSLKDNIKTVTRISQMICFIFLDGAERAQKFANTFSGMADNRKISYNHKSAYNKCKDVYKEIEEIYYDAFHEFDEKINNAKAEEELKKVEDKTKECTRKLSDISMGDAEGPYQWKLATVNIDLLHIANESGMPPIGDQK